MNEEIMNEVIKSIATSTNDEILTVMGKMADLINSATHWQYKNNYLRTHTNESALAEKKNLETKILGDSARLILELECLVASLHDVSFVTATTDNLEELASFKTLVLKKRYDRVLKRKREKEKKNQ